MLTTVNAMQETQKTKSDEKLRHASHLFKEMDKFRRGGILCDITVPGKLNLVPGLPAHKCVLMSARSSEGDHPRTPESPLTFSAASFASVSDDVFLDEAYSSGSEETGMEESPVKSSSESVAERLGALDNLRRQHRCCDVTLVADNGKCDAHKVVLAACSEYFRAMFTLKMKENKMDTISLAGSDITFLRRIVDFIYSGEIFIHDCQDAIDLLNLAVYYQIEHMIEHCCNYLIDNITVQNACLMMHLGHELALADLISNCRVFVHDHFTELDDTNTDVSNLKPEDLAFCLQSNRLGQYSSSQSELSVLRIVLRWLLVNSAATPDDVQDVIISNIRFALIRPLAIMSACGEVRNEGRRGAANVVPVSDAPFGQNFKRHLLLSLRYHEQLYKQPLQQKYTTCLRTEQKSWLSVDGVVVPTALKLPAGSERITKSAVSSGAEKRPIRDPFHSVVELNGFVFVLGGTRKIDEGYSATVIRYDPRLDVCIPVASMLEPRGDFVAVTYGGCIYVFGGRNRTGALSTAESYDPNTNTWKRIASLPENIYMAAGVLCRGKIYVNGGFNDYDTVGTTFCYDPDSNSWDQIYSPMMAERGYHVMIEGPDERLWAIGGVDNPFSGRNVWEVEAFDVDSRMWSFVSQVLPVGLFNSTLRLNALFSDSGHICISAVTLSKRYPMVEYDPVNRMWFEMKDRVPCLELQVDLAP